ncbi:MAG: alkaline phosphatase D family protein [Brevundimonas sp.]|jgi:phosphodiesterase/alkaline phosphatase D-like protein|uniref:alkaline phosphatase D family protein n=1 Tax=Brevundimonas sp. TaxID=1871086 RepID=UPI004033CB4C
MRNPATDATQLGEPQWRWLEEQMTVPADLRIFGSSLQVVADFPGWEAWVNFAHDHQRLIDTIRDRRVDGLICLSGDTHYGEISRLDVNTPYPLWDITSSGITEVEEFIPPQRPAARAGGPGAELRTADHRLERRRSDGPGPGARRQRRAEAGAGHPGGRSQGLSGQDGAGRVAVGPGFIS